LPEQILGEDKFFIVFFECAGYAGRSVGRYKIGVMIHKKHTLGEIRTADALFAAMPKSSGYGGSHA
jgi:hypothetical protein